MKKWKKLLLTGMLVLAVGMVTACGSSDKANDNNANTAEDNNGTGTGTTNGGTTDNGNNGNGANDTINDNNTNGMGATSGSDGSGIIEETGDVLQDGDQTVEGVQQGRIVQKIRKGLVAVGDDRGIRGEMLGGGGALGVEELQHTQLLEGVHINVGDIDARHVILLGLAVGVEEGEVFQFHRSFLSGNDGSS